MAAQQVNPISYLTACKVDLSKASTKAVLIPQGAQVTHLSVEVVSPAEAGAKLDLGIEGATDCYANDISLETKGTHIANVAFEAPSALELLASVSGATKGEAVVRAIYFTPTTIKVEF